jgi:hypothetical protein
MDDLKFYAGSKQQNRQIPRYNYYVQQVYSNECMKDEYNLIQCERATLMSTEEF